jgi:hypothetical protein
MCSSPFSIYFLKNDTRTKSGGGGGEAVWEQAAGAFSPHLTSPQATKRNQKSRNIRKINGGRTISIDTD